MKETEKSKPPALANWLVTKFIGDKLHEEFFGDLEEVYKDRVSTNSKFYAQLMYWVDVLHLLIGFTSFNLFSNQHNPTIMYRHYLNIANRNLWRNKVYSLINIGGLAVGMGVCLLICQYVYFELSYDKFHSNAPNIYRLTQTEIRNGEDHDTGVYTTYALGPSGKEGIPEVKDFVRIRPDEVNLVVSNSKDNIVFQENKICYVDSNYLELFDFPLALGDWESALNQKYNVVIAEHTATKYFGNTNPLGKMLRVHGGGWLSGDFIVTGVLKKLPVHSHLQFDILLPMEFLLEHWKPYKEHGGWEDTDFVTYVTLFENAGPKKVGEKLDKLINDYVGKELAQSNIKLSTELMPITDIHLRSDRLKEDPVNNKGNIRDIQFFTIIAIFILFMAWINYINLLLHALCIGQRRSVYVNPLVRSEDN